MKGKICTCKHPVGGTRCVGGRNALSSHTMSASIHAMKQDVYKGKPVKFIGGIRMNTSRKISSAQTKYKL